MTADLRNLLDDLATAEPVPAPGLAQRAWSDGRRRRLRSRLQVVVAAAAAAALVALVAPGLPASVGVPQFAGGGAAGVDGHPERIGRQWWVRDLPDRPGPVAALLETADSSWYAVRADGHRWQLPRTDLQVSALSRDGRMLAYLAAAEGPLVLHDLVDGRRVVLDQLYAGGRRPGPGLHQLSVGAPGQWSPDGRQLLLWGAGGMLLVDAADGSLDQLTQPGMPLGWVADDRIAWLAVPGPETPTGPLRVVVSDQRGQTQSSVTLRDTAAVSGDVRAAAMAADGSSLVVLSNVSKLLRFRLPSGAPAPAPVGIEGLFACAPAVRPDGTVVVSVTPPVLVSGRAVEVSPSGARPFTVTAQSVGAHCLHWAADALAGPARGGGLLGPHDAVWTWWWREVLLGAVALAGAVALLRRNRERLRQRPPSAAPEEQGVSWYA